MEPQVLRLRKDYLRSTVTSTVRVAAAKDVKINTELAAGEKQQHKRQELRLHSR